MIKSLAYNAALLALLSFSPMAALADYSLRDGENSAEVSFQEERVTVRLQRPGKDNPRSVLLTLYDAARRPVTLELKSLAIPEADKSGIATYAGTVSPARQSYAGIELRIPLSRGRPEVMRLKTTASPNRPQPK